MPMLTRLLQWAFLCRPNPAFATLLTYPVCRFPWDINLRPELYTHYYKREFPARFHDAMDTRRWGPGERLVFEPYTQQAFESSFAWISEREIFENGKMGSGKYEESIVSVSSD